RVLAWQQLGIGDDRASALEARLGAADSDGELGAVRLAEHEQRDELLAHLLVGLDRRQDALLAGAIVRRDELRAARAVETCDVCVHSILLVRSVTRLSPGIETPTSVLVPGQVLNPLLNRVLRTAGRRNTCPMRAIVGRSAELAEIGRALDDVDAGSGRLVLVAG